MQSSSPEDTSRPNVNRKKLLLSLAALGVLTGAAVVAGGLWFLLHSPSHRADGPIVALADRPPSGSRSMTAQSPASVATPRPSHPADGMPLILPPAKKRAVPTAHSSAPDRSDAAMDSSDTHDSDDDDDAP